MNTYNVNRTKNTLVEKQYCPAQKHIQKCNGFNGYSGNCIGFYGNYNGVCDGF